jgi:predicted DNA-binding transcriptional regulator YafY
LVEWLRSGRQLTTTLAAEAFDVSRRTVARDLAYLRDVLALEVTFDPAQNSYVLAEEHTALPYLAFPTLAPVLLDAKPTAASQGHRATISVRYSAPAIQAYLARGGQIPHGVLNEDGTLDLSFSPHNLDEFMSYVLSRGHKLEVLGPEDFRRRVHMEIRRMLTVYEDGTPPEA